MNSNQFSLFVSCAAELETLLADELKDLGINDTRLGYRGVYVDVWDWPAIYKINYASRLASRVLLPLSRFKCYDNNSLYRGVKEIEWHQFITGRTKIAIDANVKHRQLRNSLFAAQTMKDAICDQIREKMGRRPSVDLQNPDVQLNLFIHDDSAIISFDTSGAPLHKRGYRQESGEAPIQETLAAAILRLAKYSKEDILLDPCCGGGTFLIEAALIASQTPPGYLRKHWGFTHHPQYDQTEWLRARNQLDLARTPLHPQRFFGIDISRNAIRICKLNLKAAGFQKEIDVTQSDFRDFIPMVAPSLVVANPPYGRRLEEEELLRPLYRALGNFLKNTCPKSSRGYIFTGNLELAKEVGLAAKRRYPLNNGGIESRLLEYEIF